MRRCLDRLLATALLVSLALPASAGELACYEEVVVPPVYGEVESFGPVGPARGVEAVTSGQYAVVTDFLPVRPSITTADAVPPTYGTVARARVVSPARNVVRIKPAVTRAVIETVVVKPARESWEWRIIDGKRVKCRVVIPAKTAQRKRTVIVEPEQRWIEQMPAVTRIEMERVPVAPRGVKIRTSPPLYMPQQRIVQVTPAQRYVTEVEPPPYGIIKERVVVRPGGTALKRIKVRGC